MKLKNSTAFLTAVTLSAAGLVLAATTPGQAGTPDDNNLTTNKILTPKIVPSPRISDGTDKTVPADIDDANIVYAPKKAVVQPTDSADAADDAGDDSFASLTEAVAAQDMPADMDEELRCLATGVFYESKGEPLSGQLAVARVILNRAKSHRFPKSVCAVLLQPRQFSFVRGGRLPRVNTASRTWKTAVAVAQVAMNDEWKSPVPGALFFHATYVSPRWRLAKIKTIGRHIFYR